MKYLAVLAATAFLAQQQASATVDFIDDFTAENATTRLNNRALDSRIVGRNNVVDPKKYSFFVRIGIDVEDDNFQCGGTLIAPDVVLTAANCFYNDRGEFMDPGDGGTSNTKAYIYYDSINNNDNTNKKRRCKKVIIDPEYNHHSSYSDFALCILDGKVPGLSFNGNDLTFNDGDSWITLNDDSSVPEDGELLTSIGFGNTESSQILQEIVDGIPANSNDFVEDEVDNNSRLLSSRVIGGTQVTDPSHFPFFVHIALISGSFFGKCGDVLIAPDIVLTAAHCSFDANDNFQDPTSNGNSVRVFYGQNSIEFDFFGTYVEGEKWINDPEYYQRTRHPADWWSDFALLKLKSPIIIDETNAYMVLNQDISVPADNENLTLIGFGSTENGVICPSTPGHGSDVLLKVDMPAMATSECRKNFPDVDDRMVCAGYGEEAKSLFEDCHYPDAGAGDSGGPLLQGKMMPDGRIRYTHVGVVSYGKSPGGRAGIPGVYARTSSRAHWVKEAVCGSGGLGTQSTFCNDFVVECPNGPELRYGQEYRWELINTRTGFRTSSTVDCRQTSCKPDYFEIELDGVPVPTAAPIAPTYPPWSEAPIAPTAAPVTPTNSPVAPTYAPTALTDAPGDSGSPLLKRIVFEDDQIQYVLVAITSYGSNTGRGNNGNPIVYTRISSRLDWIHEITCRETEENKRPSYCRPFDIDICQDSPSTIRFDYASKTRKSCRFVENFLKDKARTRLLRTCRLKATDHGETTFANKKVSLSSLCPRSCQICPDQCKDTKKSFSVLLEGKEVANKKCSFIEKQRLAKQRDYCASGMARLKNGRLRSIKDLCHQTCGSKLGYGRCGRYTPPVTNAPIPLPSFSGD